MTAADSAYALDRRNGTTLLTVCGGHVLSALQYVLGEVVDVRAAVAQRRRVSRIAETGIDCSMTSSDQIVLAGALDTGAPLSLHLRGGVPRGVGFSWEINGTQGVLGLTAPFGRIQLTRLSLTGGRGTETELRPIELPVDLTATWPRSPLPGNVARLYARAAAGLRAGVSSAPDFSEALKLHRLLSAIEASAESGRRMIRGPDAHWTSATQDA